MLDEIYEYTVRKKPEGKYLLARIGMLSLYVLFVTVFFIACYISRIIPLFAICPMLTWILFFFTWRYVSIEYKYTVNAGRLHLFIVYGDKNKRELVNLCIKDIQAFIPLEKSERRLAVFAPEVKYHFLSTQNGSSDSYIILTHIDGKRAAVMIDAPDVSRKAMLYYAPEEVRRGNII